MCVCVWGGGGGGFKIELLGVQSCWFAFTNEKQSLRGWLVMYLILLSHMPALFTFIMSSVLTAGRKISILYSLP